MKVGHTDQHAFFTENGYLVVEDLLEKDEIQALVDDYGQLLKTLAPQFYAEGKIPAAFEDLPFEARLTAVLSESTENLFAHFDISLPNATITNETPFHLSKSIFNMIKNPRILDVIETLIGSEIYASPIQHVRIKPPQTKIERNQQQSSLVQRTGWHQDQGVAREESDDTEMITVWLAITDATLENGCLQIIPKSHHGEIAPHCPVGAQMIIPEKLLDSAPKPIPIKAGSALLLHRRTKHASLPNISNRIRWSFDLRYQPIGQPTGRDELPGMVVRSRQNPKSVQASYEEWVQSWHNAKKELVQQAERPKLHRWDGNAEICA
ncbi:MAG: phytanoyl-CoA dioxygenase family protein [Chloroflexota bacterium]